MKDYLTVKPTDLTLIAKKNNGVLPVERLNEVIDGRKMVGTHGSRDMPVWGREYSIKAGEYYMDVPYNQEAYVRGRILALAEYLSRIQVK